MRPLCLMICLLCATHLRAQDCKTHSLLKEGTELEYATYAPKVGVFGKNKGHYPTTRLILTVKSVKDSAGATYSIISKKGVAYNDPRDSYEKTMTVRCDGKSLFIAVDSYSPDTIFLVDIYPSVKRRGFYYAANAKATPAIWSIPLSPDGGGSPGIDKKSYKLNFILRDYEMQQGIPGGSGPQGISAVPRSNDMEAEMGTQSMKLAGKAKVKTRAGEFDCYKIEVSLTNTINGMPFEAVTIMYFNPEIGLVKTETKQLKYPTGYTELVNVKD